MRTHLLILRTPPGECSAVVGTTPGGEELMWIYEGMVRVLVCSGCGVELLRLEPFDKRPAGKPRKWCSDACRMRTVRSRR